MSQRDLGREVFRAAYRTVDEARLAAESVASVRWQIGRLPHLEQLNRTLDALVIVHGPFGHDVMERLLRLADRIDRDQRGHGLGDFTDCDAWDRIARGDVAGLLGRFETPPFGLRVS